MTTARTTAGVVGRFGALVVVAAGAAIVGLGTACNAAATPFDPAVPFRPDNPPPILWHVPAPSGVDLGDDVSLNPQPLPPGPDRGRRVGLNPQPLPPGPDLRLGPWMLPRF